MDALSATSLALLGSPPKRRHTVALVLVSLLAIATAFVCLAVAVGSSDADDRQGFGAAGLGLLAWLGWRVWSRRGHRGELTIDGDGMLADFPAVLHEPLHIPRANLRAAVVERDDHAEHRFRVHATSGPFWGGGRKDGWLWERHCGSAVPALMREERDEPNVALIFEPPVPAPRIRGRGHHGPLAGEQMAGLLLRVDDPAAAEDALHALGVLRPLTVPDALALADGLGWSEEPAADSRRALLARSTQRTGWLLLAGGTIFPVCGLLAAFAGFTLWRGEKRRSGASLMVAGAIVCAVRTATIVM